MKTIPYGRQSIGKSDIDAVVSVLKSDFLTTGPKVAEFERALGKFVGAKNVVAANSGTSALDIAVAALSLPAGSEIITTPLTFAASANCCLYNGCRPVFADISMQTLNIDPEQLEKKITEKTKAILYVDYAGQPCEIGGIRAIAERHGLKTIEDAAHSLGSEYRSKKIGSLADLTCFSFHPVKQMTTGEGGAVATQDDNLAGKLRMLRNHGIDKAPQQRADYKYDMKMLGRNYRITDMQCALGISQLKKLPKFLEKRREIGRWYAEELSGLPVESPVVLPYVKHAWHIYPVLLAGGIGRDAVFAGMRKRGIGVNVHYIPVYKFSYYRKLGYSGDGCPNAEAAYARLLTLPMHVGLERRDVKRIAGALEKSIKEAEG